MKKSVYYSIKDREYIYKNAKKTVRQKTAPKWSDIITTIGLSKVQSLVVEVDPLLSKGELSQNIKFQVYEKLRLDLYKQYTVEYFYVDTNKYMCVVASSEYLQNNILNKSPQINLVSIAPLTYQTLYHNKILDTNGIDCFVYFGEEESFYVIYKYGVIQSYEHISFSLKEVHKNNFSDILYSDFCEMITTDKITLDYFAINILNILKNRFVQILKNYEISSFDNLFVDADCNLGSSLYKKANEILDKNIKKLGFNTKLLGIDALSALNLLYLKSYPKHKKQSINFNQKAINNSFVSKMIISFVASFIMAFFIPIYQYMHSIQIKSQIEQNRTKLQDVNLSLDSLLKKLKQKELTINKNEEILKNRHISYDKMILQIKTYANNNIKRDRAQLLLYLTKHLNSSKVNIKNIKISTKNSSSSVELNLYSKNQHNIANFLANLRGKLVNIEVNYIKKVSTHYEADIEVII